MTQQTPIPPPPPTPLPPPVVDPGLASLQVQFAQAQVQLAGLQAQWTGLKAQLDEMVRSNPARPPVLQQWADVGVQIAKVQGDIATLQARIAQKQGRPVFAPAATIPVIPRTYIAPSVVVPVVSVMMLVLLFPLSVAWGKRILRRTPSTASVPIDVTMRLERIEQAVDTIAIEVERISEGQRFVTKLMAERPAQVGAEQPAMAKQPLALGAGAMEPIVVAERELVRQRVVTPH